MPKLVILDGNSLLYRGFFAMRYLSTSTGIPTNAVHTFANMVLLLLEREKPDKIFAAFDPPGDTFRHEEMESYKGTRQAMPDDLRPQCAIAREVAEAFRLPVVEIPGFEADDVVGTLAQKGKELGYEVLIVSGDGDMLQLVDDNAGPVRVMITVKGITDTVVYDEAAVIARYGLTPAQIPDFKGLKGDSSDNLPGVPGIGEKGASKLLQAYGTVEGLIDHAAELPEKQRDTLIANKDLALQCKRLATIIRDVPMPEWLDLTPDHQEVGPDFAAVRAIFERLEMRNLTKRINEIEAKRSQLNNYELTAPVEAPKKVDVEGKILCTPEDIETLVERLLVEESPVAFTLQTEPRRGSFMTSGLQGVAVGFGDASYYLAWPDASSALRAWFEDSSRPKVVHDLKFTAGVLGLQSISLNGVVFDTHLAAYLLNAGRSSYLLSDLANDNLKVELVADTADPAGYAMDEASVIAALEPVLRPRIEADGLSSLLTDLEIPLSYVIARLERNGVAIDCELMRQVSDHMAAQIATLENEIYDIAGVKFSIGSTKQLQEVLFERMKLPSGKKTKTGYSTGADVLQDLAAKGFAIADKIVAWRENTKLKSTYADTLPTLCHANTGKLHTTLSQTIASSGRLSSSNPNLQNIPIRTEVGREIRKAFVASPGNVLVSADYSQIELRIFAHLSKDANLVRAFKDGEDIHARTARLIFNVPEGEPVTGDQRRQAKTINFAVIYGAGAFRVSAELGIPQSESSALIKAYLSSYPDVKVFMDAMLAEARTNGYVKTLLGRRRYVPDLNSSNFQFRQAAEREAGNMPIQGTGADIIKLAMLRVDKALSESNLKAKMILQVHDELVFDSPPDEVTRLATIIREAMENAYQLDVHLGVEVKTGHNWWEVTPVESEEEAEFALA